MAIVDLDNHIMTRLQLLQLGTGNLPVYPYDVYRSKGITKFPCCAIERQAIAQRFEDARPYVDLFYPSSETMTVTVQDELGGGEATGPQFYTKKPYPTAIDVHYLIDIFATTRAQADQILELIWEVLPQGHRPKIAGRVCTFCHGPITNLDKLEHPLFRTNIRFHVTDFYIDKLESKIIPPITGGYLDIETQPEEFTNEQN